MLAYSFYESDNRVLRYSRALVDRGDEVDVIALRNPDQPDFEIMDRVKVFRIQTRVRNEKGKLSYLYRLLRFFVVSSIVLSKKHLEKRYDVIHVHSVPDFEVFAAWLPKLMGAKVILDIHDIVPEFYCSKFRTNEGSFLFTALKFAEKISIMFSNHVIISNHIWGERLISRSVSKEKCSVILNYPDRSIFSPRSRRENGHKFIMMYPGTLNWHQGLDIAIEAFGKIKREVPSLELHIYGQGSELERLKVMADTLGLRDRVIFQSTLPIEEIAKVMADANLGVIPKRNDPFGGEAFSTKSLEFMTLGIPVVMSETKVDKYYFNHSVVRFFEPENVNALASAMLGMIRDEGRRKGLSENASKFVADFSWDRKKGEYLDLVDRLTGSVDCKP